MSLTELLSDYTSFMRDYNHIVKSVRWRYGLSWATAEDVTMKGVEYALKTLLDPERPEPATEEDFCRLAKSNAMRRALDELDRAKRDPVQDSTNAMVDYDMDGDDPGTVEHPALMKAAKRQWEAAREDADRKAKASLCMKLLPRIYAAAKTCARDQAVYREAVLEQVPLKEVCAKYGITINNLYQIRHRVRNDLAKYGPEIVNTAFCA